MRLRHEAHDEAPDSRGHEEFLRSGRTPWRRSWGLGVVVIAGFVIGAPISRLLETYRGVVLERKGDNMFLGFDENRPPKWHTAIDAAVVGTIVTKERGEWSPQASEPLGRDIKLIQMQKRYVSAYDATIVRIDKPVSQGQASVAVAEGADGTRIRVPLFNDELAGAAVGRHLRKFPNAWDPVLIDEDLPATQAPLAPSPNVAKPPVP